MAADLESLRNELSSSKIDFDNYKKRTRLATMKLQQQLASVSTSQDSKTAELQGQVEAFQKRENELTEEVKHSREMLTRMREDLEAKDLLLKSMEKQTGSMQTVMQVLGEERDHLRNEKELAEKKVEDLEQAKQLIMQEMRNQRQAYEEELKQSVVVTTPTTNEATPLSEEVSGGIYEEKEEKMKEEEGLPEKVEVEDEHEHDQKIEEDTQQPILSEIGANALLRALENSNEETLGLLHLPHKEIELMREELVSLRARLVDAEKYGR